MLCQKTLQRTDILQTNARHRNSNQIQDTQVSNLLLRAQETTKIRKKTRFFNRLTARSLQRLKESKTRNRTKSYSRCNRIAEITLKVHQISKIGAKCRGAFTRWSRRSKRITNSLTFLWTKLFTRLPSKTWIYQALARSAAALSQSV